MYKDPNYSIEERVSDLLARMTLAEKIGQMTQVEKNSLTPAEVTNNFIGSVLSGGGGNPIPNTPESWAQMVCSFQQPALQTRLGIPLIYGVDAVHGHNNVKGAVIFPHNIGLGATRDTALVERIGQITATELLATGVHWNFAPTVAVPQDIRWGRTYEGYSENTALVCEMGTAYLRGLQNANGMPNLSHPHTILGSVKHFVGDGATRWGSTPSYDWFDHVWQSDDERWSIDQGNAEIDETTLRAIHLPPYQAAIAAGARNIMVSYSSWHGLKMHAHRYLLTDVLKGELGFTGFLATDWMGVHQLNPIYYTGVVAAVNAGLDMIMVPFDYQGFIFTLAGAVENGDVSIERINDAVRRILRVKFELGLFERPYGDESLLSLVGSEAHRAVAREAVRKSLVLLKNDQQALPLAKDTSLILVAGQAADDIGLQCGGWTIEWQGRAGNITPGTTLLTAIKTTISANTLVRYEATGEFDQADTSLADIGLVILSEPAYAEGEGDRADLNLPATDIALVERVRPRCQNLVIILFSGRPLLITNLLAKCDAFVAAWLPGTEGQGITDALFGDYPFTGKLPYTWPQSMAQIPLITLANGTSQPLFPFGYGLAS
jgi:beta-glucosidase